MVECHPNLVVRFSFLKDMDYTNQFFISEVGGVKENEQGKVGVYVTAIITYENTFMVNTQLMTLYIYLGEVLACNDII